MDRRPGVSRAAPLGRTARIIAACLLLHGVSAPAFAQVQVGEILVADFDAGPSSLGRLFRIEPQTGSRLLLTEFSTAGTGGQDPRWIAVERTGGILIVDQTAGTGQLGALIRVDPITGAATTLSDFGSAAQGLIGGNPQGVAVELDGHILVMDMGSATVPSRLFRIDAATGARTVLSDFSVGVNTGFGSAIAVESTGDILVLDQTANPRLLRVDPATGARTVLTVLNQGADPASAPRGIAVESSGGILVAEIATGTSGLGSLFRVDRLTGARVRLSDFGNPAEGPLGANPQGVTVEASGQILVTDQFVGTSGAGALFRVDPISGMRELLSDFGAAVQGAIGVNPFGVAIFPAMPGTLVVVKDVINDNGGTHAAADWTVTVAGARPSPVTFAGASSPGTIVLVDAGTYNVSETGPQGYSSTSSADCLGTIAPGEVKTCALTSNDLPATLIVVKTVINDNGGTSAPGDWTITVDAMQASPSSFAGQSSPGTTVTFNPGPYSVSEVGPTAYTSVLSADCSGMLGAGETKTCVSSSDDLDVTPPETTITSAPPAETTATNATFSFSATEPGIFSCSLDGAPYVECVSPQSYVGLGFGGHAFAVRATDAAGNADPTPATHTWTIQPTVLPDLTVSALTVKGGGKVRGVPFSVNATVTNASTTPAGASTLTFYLSADPVLNTTTDLLLGSREVPALAAGDSSSEMTSLTVPGTVSLGDWFVVAAADAGDAVAETNETNNTLARRVKVRR